VFFVVAKTIHKNSSGSQIIDNSPSEEVAAATSSYVLNNVITRNGA
jgi:hypothetical protein